MKFDVIILDPPAFIKKQKDKKEGLLLINGLMKQHKVITLKVF